jgi:hypothetical protein
VRLHVYRNLTRGCWSIRRAGRVVAHEQHMVLHSCILRIRETGRCGAISEGQRNVHAWVEGTPCGSTDGKLIEIGYNPFLASMFTIRPGFDPVNDAQIVVLSADEGVCCALRPLLSRCRRSWRHAAACHRQDPRQQAGPRGILITAPRE